MRFTLHTHAHVNLGYLPNDLGGNKPSDQVIIIITSITISITVIAAAASKIAQSGTKSFVSISIAIAVSRKNIACGIAGQKVVHEGLMVYYMQTSRLVWC